MSILSWCVTAVGFNASWLHLSPATQLPVPISCAHLGTGIVTFIWHSILAQYREQSSPWSSLPGGKHMAQAADARNVGHIYPKERTNAVLRILSHMDQQGHQCMHIPSKTGPYKACAIPPKGERPASWSCEPVKRWGADGGKSDPVNGILAESTNSSFLVSYLNTDILHLFGQTILKSPCKFA